MRRALPLLALLAAAAACDRPATEPGQQGSRIEATADQVIYGLRHRMTEQGIRKLDLYADTAYTQPDDPNVDLIGVRLTFYDDTGRQSGTLTSRTGTYDLRTETMVAEGDVVLAIEQEGRTRVIETEELHMERRSDRIWSPVATVMREGGQTYRGTSFESDLDFENLTVDELRTSDIPTRGAAGPGSAAPSRPASPPAPPAGEATVGEPAAPAAEETTTVVPDAEEETPGTPEERS